MLRIVSPRTVTKLGEAINLIKVSLAWAVQIKYVSSPCGVKEFILVSINCYEHINSTGINIRGNFLI